MKAFFIGYDKMVHVDAIQVSNMTKCNSKFDHKLDCLLWAMHCSSSKWKIYLFHFYSYIKFRNHSSHSQSNSGQCTINGWLERPRRGKKYISCAGTFFLLSDKACFEFIASFPEENSRISHPRLLSSEEIINWVNIFLYTGLFDVIKWYRNAEGNLV